MVTLQPNYRHSVTHLLKLVKGDKMRNRRNALILHQMRVDSATMRMMAMTLTPQVVCLTGREAPPVDCASQNPSWAHTQSHTVDHTHNTHEPTQVYCSQVLFTCCYIQICVATSEYQLLDLNICCQILILVATSLYLNPNQRAVQSRSLLHLGQCRHHQTNIGRQIAQMICATQYSHEPKVNGDDQVKKGFWEAFS